MNICWNIVLFIQISSRKHSPHIQKYIVSLVVCLCEVNNDLEMKLNGLQAFGPGIMFAYCSNYGDE